jgi:hypothetical protein
MYLQELRHAQQIITKVTKSGPFLGPSSDLSVYQNPWKKLYSLTDCIEPIMGCGKQVINYNNAPSPFPFTSDWLRKFWAKCLLYKYRSKSRPSDSSCLHDLWRWNWQSIPKRRHIKFRRRGITRKKEYNIQNMAKIFN